MLPCCVLGRSAGTRVLADSSQCCPRCDLRCVRRGIKLGAACPRRDSVSARRRGGAHSMLVRAQAEKYVSPFIRPKALFLDAAGTFLLPSENVADVYLRYSRPHGVDLPVNEVRTGFRRAFNEPWPGPLRYVGDAKDFWRRVVFKSLHTSNDDIANDIYDYYATKDAWNVAPGVHDALVRVRQAGVKTCVISNFDDRLRPILKELELDDLFDATVVSAEVQAEKPDPRIFRAACEAVGVDPPDDFVIHIGDDRRNDVWGARACGITAWLWGDDVKRFDEVADRIVCGNMAI